MLTRTKKINEHNIYRSAVSMKSRKMASPSFIFAWMLPMNLGTSLYRGGGDGEIVAIVSF